MGGVVSWLERPVRFGVLIVAGLALIAAAFAAGLGLSGTFASHSDPDEVHACVKTQTGVMRYVWSPAQCTYGEYPVSWNGGNGFANVEFFSTPPINATSGTLTTVFLTCDSGVLIDAGYSANPPTNIETGDVGPTSTSSWTATVRPAQNTQLVFSAICASSSDAPAALSSGLQFSVEEVEE